MAVRSLYHFLRSGDMAELGGVSAEAPNPTAHISARRPKVQPRCPYTLPELRALLAACEAPEERAFLLFFIGSGCRRSEALGLRRADVDWVRGEVLIRGKGAKERRVAPGRHAMLALGRCSNRSGRLWPLSERQAQRLLARIARRATVVGATFHRFRVTAATGLMARGMALDELQQVLGHSEIRTTAHYAAYNVAQRALAQQARLSLADAL